MGFLTSIFGGSDNAVVTALIALLVVLLVIVIGVWALKAVFRAGRGVARGRNRRLNIVDAMPVDGRRQLVLIRRDNVEHLVMIGGGEDLVIESGIPAPVTAQPQPVVARGRGGRGSSKAEPVAMVPPVQPAPAIRQQATPARGAAKQATPAEQPAASAAPKIIAAPAEPTVAGSARAALAERFRAIAARPVPPPPPVTGADWKPTDRLNELGRPGDRRSSSLRHTGLLRAVSRLEPMVPGNDTDPADRDDWDVRASRRADEE